ncbi:MAG TPA: GTPase domain-containing protein [Holophagaceae bacterium]|jgi:signal recognition particle receptor subunit beta|nr:GTPase domain-containing protein [Holophagaceae bacterium]
MVFFNHATRQMTAKIVYYGPGLCGKTTNLNTIYGKTSQKARGEMVSLNTETDRTLFFDLLPMDVGMVGGFKTKLQLYTVPGQVFYNSTRKLVLKGVDGIVFVVDSQTPMLDACKESYQNLLENMKELGIEVSAIPVVYQWNKRDLKNVVPVEELERTFNERGLPSFQAVASDGSGVFETLRGITKLALAHIKAHHLGETAGPKPAPAPPAPAAHSPSMPTPAQALDLSDLSAAGDLMDSTNPGTMDITGITMDAPDFPEPPEPAPKPKEKEDVLSTRPMTAADVAASVAKAKDRPAAKPAPVVAATPRIAVPKIAMPTLPTAPAPKAAQPKSAASLNNLLGELTQVGRMGAPSVLRLDLPEGLEGEIEVIVQVKAAGELIAEKRLDRPSPPKGIAAKLTVELKRG